MPSGKVIGIDLAAAHVQAARLRAPASIPILQGDIMNAPLAPASFDFIWSVNTINHLRDPVGGAKRLATLLGGGGRIAVGQSALLPDMYFAWDSRLERVTNEAVRHYYLTRYRLGERDLASVRAIVGVLRRAGLRNVSTRTIAIERVSPVDEATESYLVEAIFGGTWRERLRLYMADDDYAELMRLCDPCSADYALKRPDFHFLQTFTLAIGEI